MKKTDTMPHWLLVLCCCGMSASSIGLGINSMGLYNGPVSAALGVGIGDVSMYLTIVNLTSGLCSPLAVSLLKKYDLRALLAVGVVGSAVCYIGMAAVTALWQMYALALVSGVCKALFSMVVIGVIIGNWFESKMGLAVGLALSASGVAAAVFNPLMNSMIEQFGWRASYLICAAITMLCAGPAVFYVRLYPSQKNLPRYGKTKVEAPAAEKTAACSNEPKQKAIFSPVVLMVAGIGALTAGVTGMGSHLVPFAASIGLSSSVGAALTSMTMIGNTGSKLLLGVLCDALGPKKACGLMMILSGVGCVCLGAAGMLPSAVLVAAALLLGMSYSLGGVGLSTLSREVFGQEQFSSLYSYVSIAAYVGSALMISLIGYVYDWTGSYVPALLGCAVMCAIGLALLLSVYRMAAPKKSQASA